MPQHGAPSQPQQQVLGATVDPLDTLAGQGLRQPRVDWPAQPVIVHGQAQDGLTRQMRFKTAAGSFDFGKLGHGGQEYYDCIVRSRRASCSCHHKSGGRPQRISRARLTAETASASSALTPRA